MRLKILPDGSVGAVYHEDLLPLVRRLGRMTARRASDVGWDENTQQWQAVSKVTGEILASHESRREAVRLEVAAIEQTLDKYV